MWKIGINIYTKKELCVKLVIYKNSCGCFCSMDGWTKNLFWMTVLNEKNAQHPCIERDVLHKLDK